MTYSKTKHRLCLLRSLWFIQPLEGAVTDRVVFVPPLTSEATSRWPDNQVEQQPEWEARQQAVSGPGSAKHFTPPVQPSALPQPSDLWEVCQVFVGFYTRKAPGLEYPSQLVLIFTPTLSQWTLVATVSSQPLLKCLNQSPSVCGFQVKNTHHRPFTVFPTEVTFVLYLRS